MAAAPLQSAHAGLKHVHRAPLHEVAQGVTAEPAAIAVCNLTVAYNRHPAVHHLTGAFRAGSLTALCGPNGGGKSSLLKAIVGLAPIVSGHVDIAADRRRAIAYLPQVVEVDRGFPLKVLDVADLGHWRRSGAFGRLTAAHRQQSLAALVAVGLQGLETRSIEALSVGQFQRLLFARLIVENAPIILLDEPFNAIDQRTTEDLLRLIVGWSTQGRTVVAALHDLDMVRRAFPEAVLVAREPIAWGETSDVLSDANLARARSLAEGWLENAPVCEVPA
jgi:zinc/manganese transport system ATP-binding protein